MMGLGSGIFGRRVRSLQIKNSGVQSLNAGASFVFTHDLGLSKPSIIVWMDDSGGGSGGAPYFVAELVRPGQTSNGRASVQDLGLNSAIITNETAGPVDIYAVAIG